MHNIDLYASMCQFSSGMLCSQPHLWFFVQVYAIVMPWTCSFCSLHTGSSCLCLAMNYMQFPADQCIACAGHNGRAWQKSWSNHCILCQQAVCPIFSVRNHSCLSLMQTRNYKFYQQRPVSS